MIKINTLCFLHNLNVLIIISYFYARQVSRAYTRKDIKISRIIYKIYTYIIIFSIPIFTLNLKILKESDVVFFCLNFYISFLG